VRLVVNAPTRPSALPEHPTQRPPFATDLTASMVASVLLFEARLSVAAPTTGLDCTAKTTGATIMLAKPCASMAVFASRPRR
jgi:hypothetical protein